MATKSVECRKGAELVKGGKTITAAALEAGVSRLTLAKFISEHGGKVDPLAAQFAQAQGFIAQGDSVKVAATKSKMKVFTLYRKLSAKKTDKRLRKGSVRTAVKKRAAKETIDDVTVNQIEFGSGSKRIVAIFGAPHEIAQMIQQLL